MKKVILACITFLIFILIIVGIIICKKENDLKKYQMIKEKISKEAINYLNINRPVKYNEEQEYYLDEIDIISPYNRGAKQAILLDIDNKSYCKTIIYGKCKKEKWDVEVYLSCKKYEDDDYAIYRKLYETNRTTIKNNQ